MGRSGRKSSAGAALRQAQEDTSRREEFLLGLRFQTLTLKDGALKEDKKTKEPFLLRGDIDDLQREDWDSSSVITYRCQGDLGAVFFQNGRATHASSPGSKDIVSLKDKGLLARIPPLPPLEDILKKADAEAEEELASLGGDLRRKMVLQSKYTGKYKAEALKEQKERALSILRGNKSQSQSA